MKKFTFQWLGCFILLLFVGNSIKAQTKLISEVGANITSLEQLQDGDAIAFWNTGRSAYVFLDRKNGEPAYMMRTALPIGEEASSNYYFIVKKTDAGKYTFQDKNGNYMPVFGKSEVPRPSETAGEFTITQSDDKWLIQTPDGIYFNGNGDGGDFLGWNEAGGNSLYEIRKLTLKAATTYTFNFVDENNSAISSATLTTANATLTIPSVALYKPTKATSNSQEITITDNTISAASVGADNVITITCTENLPFTVTTDKANATWYFLRIHNNSNKRFVKYDATAGKLVPINESDINLYDGTQLWCITGSIKEGVKVYNKAYPELAMTYAEGQVSMADDASNTTWEITGSSAPAGVGLDNAFCLKNSNSYINYDAYNKVITYYSGNDDGSSFVAVPLADMTESIISQLENSYNNIPDMAVGAPKNLATIKAAIETFKNAQTEENYNAIQTAVENSEKVVLEPNKYYRLESVYSRGKYMEIQSASATASALDEANASQIWHFNATDDTHYTMSAQGAYTIAATQGSTAITTTTEAESASQFALASRESAAQYGFDPANGLELHYNGGANILGWDGGNGSSWYLIQTTAIKVTIGETGYATVNYPFAVQVPEGVTVYTGSVDTEKAIFTLNEVKDGIIPANTPVILKGNADTYTLTILPSDEEISEVTKTLNGTLLSKEIAETNAYILGNGTKGIGFYQISEDDRTLAANKAYLVLPATASAVRSIIFSDGTTTGIESTVAEGTETEEYYDLQGRRVMNPTKGIYVTKSGKKVVINK